MKRILAFFHTVILSLLICGQASAGCFPSFPTFGRWQDGCGGAWWEGSSLTFYAPFDDPADPLKLIHGTSTLSFTRATTATYVHPTTGLITSAAENQLRIEANGALIEGQRTNIGLYSEDSSNWLLYGGAGSVVADNIIAPDGTLTADRWNHGNYLYQLYNYTGGTTYTISAWIRSVNPTGYVGIYLKDISTSQEVPLTSTWQRFSYTTVVAASGNQDYGFFVSSITPSDIYVWGVQLEVGSFPSSYIGPTTTAAVTRNMSQVSFATASNLDNAAGTVAVQWTPRFANTVTASGNYYIFDSGSLEAYWNSTDDKIYLTDGTNTISTAALTFSANVAKDLAFTWGAAGLSITVDGTDTTGATYTAAVPGANTFIGADTTPANLLYGNEKNLRVWNRQMSVSERAVIAP